MSGRSGTLPLRETISVAHTPETARAAADRLLVELSSTRFRYASEDDLQVGLGQLLERAGRRYEREVRRSEGDRGVDPAGAACGQARHVDARQHRNLGRPQRALGTRVEDRGVTGLTSPEARAIQALLEHPDGVHIPRGMHPSGAGSKTWRRLIDRGLVLRVVDPAGAGRGSTWSVTPRGREVYAAVIDAIAEDFADALRAEPGDWVELRPNVFADRLEYEDVPRWENEGGALMDYRRWDDSDGPADSHDVDAVVNAALRGLAS